MHDIFSLISSVIFWVNEGLCVFIYTKINEYTLLDVILRKV